MKQRKLEQDIIEYLKIHPFGKTEDEIIDKLTHKNDNNISENDIKNAIKNLKTNEDVIVVGNKIRC